MFTRIENYALVYLWAAVENHVGICAACAGAIKQRSIATFASVRRSYVQLRHKSSWPSSTGASWPPASWSSTDATTGRTQSTEDRNAFVRTDSLPDENPSYPCAAATDRVRGMRLELVAVSPSLSDPIVLPESKL